ncbi:2-hydroxyhepta-2,4-diene-1,7-dioate isomerase [Thermogymnomonas acidicola]|uniref:2-hydroxyhepta-2,4-diene-1,7-dioate isomerase n=1 Tax=Thermogymnomonas acidicola TaxID=399579 RepID=A0AA37BQ12_9ARCH|nr:fumarylacetoacetate hydrolase family protein [Thermogymnomonas acidicola]GGM68623.1 2-hydroxyhepta-2,4-diene-1,7-dioate isomerase [Thermogymnomonas acidicola]
MKLGTVRVKGKSEAVIVKGGELYSISDAARDLGIKGHIRSVKDVVQLDGRLREVIIEHSEGFRIDGSPAMQAPVQGPDKVILAAINYKTHANEQSFKGMEDPFFFTKFPSCISGPEDPIVIPRSSSMVDYEIELALVIGKRSKYVSEREAMDSVFGYMVLNDVSFRDYQLGKDLKSPPPLGHNWVMGKAMDMAAPTGPVLVTSDEIGDPYSLQMELRVNGKTRQKASTGEMVFKIDRMVSYLSQGITLLPGDIISTGTPAGVAAFTDRNFLRAGDVVEAEISKIGRLRNPVRNE